MKRIRLRCYMRGLGIGIAVTVLITGIAAGRRRGAMTDDEVRARARELGMVESTVLSQMQSQQKQDNTDDTDDPKSTDDTDDPEKMDNPGDGDGNVPEKDTAPESDDASGGNDTPGSGDTPEGSDIAEDNDTPESGGQPEDGSSTLPDGGEHSGDEQTVLFVITRGESSASVSQALADLGLVRDAGAYDRYLCDNGYATRIVAGTYQIPVGISEDEITAMITK